MNCRRLSLVLVCACLVLPLTAGAQTAAVKRLARKHYELGEQLYKISNYSRALAEFQEAYRLYPKPGLLFNMARCHEVLAHLQPALRYYKLYLEKSPSAPNRELVVTRVAMLEARLKKAREAEKPEPPVKPVKSEPPVKPPPASAPTAAPASASEKLAPEPAPPRRTWRRTAGWVALAAGGAVLAGGLVMGGLAASRSSEYDDVKAGDRYHDQLEGIRQEGERYETAQVVMLVAGGVIAAAGGGLLLWEHLGHGGKERPADVALAPMISGRVMGLAGRVSF